MVTSSETTIEAIVSATKQRAGAVERHPVGLQRSDLPIPVDLDQRPRRRRHDEAEPEQGQGGAERDDHEHEDAAGLALRSRRRGRSMRGGARASSTVTITEIGNATKPMPRNSGSRLTYMRAAAARIWPQARRRASRNGAAGRQVVRESANGDQATRARSVRSVAARCPRSSGARWSRRRPRRRRSPSPRSRARRLPGTPMLRSRQSCDDRIGSVH